MTSVRPHIIGSYITTISISYMPYPEQLVHPMREELTRSGVKELRNASDVETAFSESDERTRLLIINSVCGCAAANARPAVILSQQASTLPDEFVTVFAGQDLDATNQARTYLAGIPPSSPFIALFKGTEPVFVLERRHIEGRSASAIAMDLVQSYDQFCANGNGQEAATNGASEGEESNDDSFGGDSLPPTFKSIL
jgi:putative YphP/YqiW family bacilliredoxin